MTSERFMTLPDVAEILIISASQTYALVSSGDLKGIQIGGRNQWRVERVKLEEFHPGGVPKDRAAARSATGRSSRRVARLLSKPVFAKPLSARSQRLDHHRLGVLRKQRAPELLRTPRPQHPERNIGGDPAAQLNITASSCPTCHMSGEENQRYAVTNMAMDARQPTHRDPNGHGV